MIDYPEGAELWVFAYGSLMWDPGFDVNSGAKRDHYGGVKRDHSAAAGLSPQSMGGSRARRGVPSKAAAAARAGGTCGPTGSSVG